jgi:hypothetical protein
MNADILQKGFVEVKVRIAGVLQRHRFVVTYETTAFGKVVYLETRVPMPLAELYRVANELDLPVKAPTGTLFPQGKGPKDFTIE